MTDREKAMNRSRVMNWLNEVYVTPIRALDGYTDDELRAFAKDAMELLKEQEPVSPIYENYWKHTMGRCGHCKAPLPALEGMQSKFCWMCGKAVKWG